MPFLHDDVYDNGLQVLTDDTSLLHYCSAEPVDYADAVALSLGNKSSPVVGAPEDRAPLSSPPDGRKVTISAITDGAATATDTISHYALVDVGGTRLLAAQAVVTPQPVNNTDTITSPAFEIGIPGPV